MFIDHFIRQNCALKNLENVRFSWALLGCMSATLAATPVAAYGADHDEIKLCTAPWIPFSICAKGSSEASGVHTDRLRHVFSSMDQNVSIECMPWKRCLKSVESGAFDGVFAVSRQAERDAFLTYLSVPLQSVRYVFVTLKSTDSTWQGDRRLSNLPQPIGSPFGWSVTERLRSEEPELILDTASADDDANMRKLLLGRIPTIVIEESVALSLAEQHDAADKVVILDPPFTDKIDYYLAFGKSSKEVVRQPDFLQSVEQALNRTSHSPLSVVSTP